MGFLLGEQHKLSLPPMLGDHLTHRICASTSSYSYRRKFLLNRSQTTASDLRITDRHLGHWSRALGLGLQRLTHPLSDHASSSSYPPSISLSKQFLHQRSFLESGEIALSLQKADASHSCPFQW